MFRSLLVVLASVMLFGAIAGCSAAPPIPEATATPLPVPTNTPLSPQTAAVPATAVPTVVRASPTADAKAALIGALSAALSKVRTYRVRVPEEGRLMEFVLPDRIRQVENEPITKIGSTYYQPNFADPWRVQTIGHVPFMDRGHLGWIRDQVQDSKEATFVGAGTIDGVASVGYLTSFTLVRVIPPRTPGPTPQVSEISQPVRIWFATTDGLPRRVEYGAPISVTINFYDYNVNIEINPP